jgi:anti-sigma regulatory factor (Ser/Thr protein kinase)
VPRFRADVTALAAEAGADPTVLDDVRLAVTEACANVVVHAYADRPAPGDVLVRAVADAGRLDVTVRDWGRGLGAPAVAAGLGLGLVLLRSLTSSVDVVQHPDDGLEVHLGFTLNGNGNGNAAAGDGG